MTDPAAERARVAELLGRPPMGEFEVVVRSPSGDPAVLRNAPLLPDGTPMPTRYWLCDPGLRAAIGTLESEGGVREAEAVVDPAAIAAAHARLRRRARRRPARRPHRPGPLRRGRAAPVRASSACTPTTPTGSPVATTPWGSGSTTS